MPPCTPAARGSRRDDLTQFPLNPGRNATITGLTVERHFRVPHAYEPHTLLTRPSRASPEWQESRTGAAPGHRTITGSPGGGGNRELRPIPLLSRAPRARSRALEHRNGTFPRPATV